MEASPAGPGDQPEVHKISSTRRTNQVWDLVDRWMRGRAKRVVCVDDSMTDGQLQVLVRFFFLWWHLSFSVLFPSAPAPAFAAFSPRNLIQPLQPLVAVSFMSEGPDAADRGPGPEDAVGGEVEATAAAPPPSPSSGSTAHQPQPPPHKPDEATALQPPRRCIFSEVDKKQFLNSNVREGAHRVCVWMRECRGWGGGDATVVQPLFQPPPPAARVSFRRPHTSFCAYFKGCV